MAVVYASLRDFYVLNDMPITGVSAGRRLLLGFVFDNGATQVAGGTDTLDLSVSASVDTLSGLAETRMRQGLTLTIRSCQVVQPLQSSSTEYAATLAVSGSKIQLTPKTVADWSTNATIAASAAVIPYIVHVLVDVA